MAPLTFFYRNIYNILFFKIIQSSFEHHKNLVFFTVEISIDNVTTYCVESVGRIQVAQSVLICRDFMKKWLGISRCHEGLEFIGKEKL
jgi:hypothetical protein